MRSPCISEPTVGISLALGDPRGYVDLQIRPAVGKRFPLGILQENATERIAGLVITDALPGQSAKRLYDQGHRGDGVV